MSNTCIELYPPGTLGREFIDVALNIIGLVDQTTSIAKRNDMVCINNPRTAANIMKGILESFAKDLKTNPFPLTGNDRRSLEKIIIEKIDLRNPSSIIDYVVEILNKNGIERLLDITTTPSIMRIEFYEYSRPGYLGVISDSLKRHPYKTTNLFSIALAILGAYISFLGSVRDNDKKYNVYFIPFGVFDIGILNEIKKTLMRVKTYPRAITSYFVARTLMEKSGIVADIAIGDILLINISGNRFTLSLRDKVGSDGWISVLSQLDKKTRHIMDLIAGTIISSDEKSVKTLISFMELVYKYAQCIDDALYLAIRLLTITRDGLENVEKNRKISENWIRLYNCFKKLGVEKPSSVIDVLAKKLHGIKNPCNKTLL